MAWAELPATAARSQHLITSSNRTRQMASRPPLNYFMADWIITDVICWIMARTQKETKLDLFYKCACVCETSVGTRADVPLAMQTVTEIAQAWRESACDCFRFFGGESLIGQWSAPEKIPPHTPFIFWYRTFAESDSSQQPGGGNHETRPIENVKNASILNVSQKKKARFGLFIQDHLSGLKCFPGEREC